MDAVVPVPPGRPHRAGGDLDDAIPGLHLPRRRRVGFNHLLMDGGGFRWDIQMWGTVGSGTNNAYGSGMFCHVAGQQVRSPDGVGWGSGDGREIEIGAFPVRGLQVYRRVRVYEDRQLARWLDIFDNPTGRDITVRVRYQSNIPYGIGTRVGSSGAGGIGKDDWAFMTETAHKADSPCLLHIVRARRSELKPTINFHGSAIRVEWKLTVPAHSTRILCHFESQDHSLSRHRKRMQGFDPHDVLADLPPAVRRMILNFGLGTSLADVSLQRSESSDNVRTAEGDPMNGRVLNETFTVKTFYGTVELQADEVVGMARMPDGGKGMRVLTIDGQVISGTLDDQVLRFELSRDRGVLEVPFEEIEQWSFRVSEERPLEIPFAGPAAVLRTGDRLTFDPDATRLAFHTRHGTVELAGEAMRAIEMDSAGHGVHRALFTNGGSLAGFLEPETLELHLRIGSKLSVPREMLEQIVFRDEQARDPTLTRVTLVNGDELYGRLAMETLTVESEWGTVSLGPRDVRALGFDPDRPDRVIVQLWGESRFRGRLADEWLVVKLLPGPELKLHTGLVRGLVRSQPMFPEEIRRRVQELAALLAAESYVDRQEATEQLISLGAVILPQVRGYLNTDDPEVRQRLEMVIEEIEADAGGTAEGPVPHPMRGSSGGLIIW